MEAKMGMKKHLIFLSNQEKHQKERFKKKREKGFWIYLIMISNLIWNQVED
jgi:hypothetical protein